MNRFGKTVSTPPRLPLNLGEGFRVAFDTIRSNKVRSGLTILGVSVGVVVVVLLAAFITGLRTTIQESFQASGPANFVINRFDFTAARNGDDGNGRPPWWNRPVILPVEADRVGRLASVQEALYNVQLTVTVDFDGQRVNNVQAAGHAAGWPNYTQGDFVAGRNFTPAEIRQSRTLVVLSSALAEELFGFRDPIGRLVGIARGNRNIREEFTVVGVFDPAPNIFTTVIKHWAVVPYTAATKRLNASDQQAQILIVPTDSVPPFASPGRGDRGDAKYPWPGTSRGERLRLDRVGADPEPVQPLHGDDFSRHVRIDLSGAHGGRGRGDRHHADLGH